MLTTWYGLECSQSDLTDNGDALVKKEEQDYHYTEEEQRK